MKMMLGGDHGAACDTDVGTIAVGDVDDVVKAAVGVDKLGVDNVVTACCFALQCNFCRSNCLLVELEFQ